MSGFKTKRRGSGQQRHGGVSFYRKRVVERIGSRTANARCDNEMRGRMTPIAGKNMIQLRRVRSSRAEEAFTLAEVVICLGIVAVVFGGILCAYMQNGYRAEWAGYNLAAQSQAIIAIEEARSAKWDAATNELAVLFPGGVRITTNIMDLPISGTNVMYVTNFSTLTLVNLSSNPPVQVYFVRVDSVWQYTRKNQTLLYTNTVADYFAQDQ